MSERFNVNQYWLERGQSYIHEAFPQEYHRLQERFLLDILRASRLPLDRILELGCGFGRITRLLAQAFPHAQITALDLSPAQLEHARRYCGENPNLSFQQFDFYSGAPFPGTGYDTVVAIEVFLHHPPPFLRQLCQRLAGIARHLVNIDWSEDWPWKTAEHVWVHDYAALYKGAGLQCATFVLPKKVEGMQQKLFIAAKHLSPAVLALEREVQAANASLPQSSSAEAARPNPTLPESARWPQQLDLAVQELRAAVPSGATLILVNDDLWGNESHALAGYRVFPFLERDGEYWGPPDDDQVALQELERLRRAGATYMVFAWTSFWWLDHYTGLRQCLDVAGPPLCHTARLKVFRLPPLSAPLAAPIPGHA